MKQGCYTIDELMDLTGNEKHLKDCETCNELYQDWCGFKETMRAEGAMAGDFLRLFRQRREAAALVKEIQQNKNENNALADALLERSLFPEMVIELCKQAHHAIYVNPNEAAEWLHMANTVLEKIKRETYSTEELSWAEARYYVNLAGLNIVRGYPAQAEAAYR
ncbi:MAG TPA: hypothetical protein PK014_08455, partial [Thermoanaerobaculia bacterium]|nr:hypothetical protein [Thermoanaerobaculia bacterium]HUM30139.1 hypothetical protein [Thermoanaerobaculia bacterium]HXK68411.1 hypothetical protein [Thermoanaerobaculia bacterium]